MIAAEFIDTAMRACLPPGVPPSFTIRTAQWTGAGRSRRALADVQMFDGLPAKLEVWAWAGGGSYAHRWPEMLGGDVSFEDGRWVRVQRDAAPQPDLFGEAA